MLRLVPVLLLISCAHAQAPAPALWLDLKPGPHAVGVRLDDAQAKWYPARAEGDPLRFRDYIPKLEDADMFLHAHKVSDEQIVELFDTPMFAHRDAPALDGNFPIVRIAPGGAADHAVLAEYLASHGYVISIGPGADALEIDVTSWHFAGVLPKDGAAAAARHVLRRIQSSPSRSSSTSSDGVSRK